MTWIRGSDLHVLSVDGVVFASDSRIAVAARPDRWTLTIRLVFVYYVYENCYYIDWVTA